MKTRCKGLTASFIAFFFMQGAVASDLGRSAVVWKDEAAGLRLERYSGLGAATFSEQITALRSTCFAQFPYLYATDEVVEEADLGPYFTSGDSLFLLLFHKDRVVGIANAVALVKELEAVQAPVVYVGGDVKSYCYFGEIMVLPQHRRPGLVTAIFEVITEYARSIGATKLMLATVDRPDSHPCRPVDYKDVTATWKRYGFSLFAGPKMELSWPQVDTGREEANTLTVWCKDLECAKEAL